MRQIIVALAATLAVVAPSWVVLRLMVLRRASRLGARVSRAREVLLLVFVSYGAAVMAVTVLPLRAAVFGDAGQISLIPFRSTMQCLEVTLLQPEDLFTHCTVNFFGNLALLFPMGLLLPALSRPFKAPRRFVAAALSASVGIELLQLMGRAVGGGRSVDIDDVILNVIGACAGYLVFRSAQSFLAGQKV